MDKPLSGRVSSGRDPICQPTVGHFESGSQWAPHTNRCCRIGPSMQLPRRWLSDQNGDLSKSEIPCEVHWRSLPAASWCPKCSHHCLSAVQTNEDSVCIPARFHRWWDQIESSFQYHFLQGRSTFRFPELSSWACQIHELGHTSAKCSRHLIISCLTPMDHDGSTMIHTITAVPPWEIVSKKSDAGKLNGHVLELDQWLSHGYLTPDVSPRSSPMQLTAPPTAIKALLGLAWTRGEVRCWNPRSIATVASFRNKGGNLAMARHFWKSLVTIYIIYSRYSYSHSMI